MKKIFFPTDFTDSSLVAFEYALDIAQKYGASITTFHSYTPTIPPAYASPKFYEQASEQTESLEFSRYQAFAKKMTALAESKGITNVKINHTIDQGFAVDEILEFSETEKADLIVMNTEGAKGIKAFLLGSRTADVINKAPIKVLAIPKNWAYKPIKKIAFATCFHSFEEDAILDMLEFATLLDAETHFIHVSFEIEEWNKSKLEHFKNLNWLQTHSKNIKLEIIEYNNVNKALATYVEDFEMDMLAMVKENRSFVEKVLFKSFTKDMSLKTKVPLMVCQATEDLDN